MSDNEFKVAILQMRLAKYERFAERNLEIGLELAIECYKERIEQISYMINLITSEGRDEAAPVEG
jgi:hypothetical protein